MKTKILFTAVAFVLGTSSLAPAKHHMKILKCTETETGEVHIFTHTDEKLKGLGGGDTRTAWSNATRCKNKQHEAEGKVMYHGMVRVKGTDGSYQEKFTDISIPAGQTGPTVEMLAVSTPATDHEQHETYHFRCETLK